MCPMVFTVLYASIAYTLSLLRQPQLSNFNLADWALECHFMDALEGIEDTVTPYADDPK